MANIKKETNNFLPDLLKFQGSLNGKSQLLDKLRLQGAEEVQSKDFPSKKEEDWKFISLRDLYRDSYTLARNLDIDSPDVSEYFIPESEGARLVFINGVFSAKQSSTDALPDEVIIGNLAELATENEELVEKHLNQYGDFEDDVFTSFNSAFVQDGAFIYVPKGC
ncbi:MAG: hypothetical protein U5J95_01805 [Balneolaceae bacterium]|nr:hypothetical protein [Balneolaceae bacterium]